MLEALQPEAMEPLQIAQEWLTTLRIGLRLCWPGLLLAPILTPRRVRWAWVFARYRLRRPWRRVLDHPSGRFWPVLAALLPALIPFARDWDQKSTEGPKGIIVAVLLLAVAVLQIYGQQRNNRDRIKTAAEGLKTENRLLDLILEIAEGRREAAEGRKEAEETGLSILDAISNLAAEQRRWRRRSRIGARVIGAEISAFPSQDTADDDGG